MNAQTVIEEMNSDAKSLEFYEEPPLKGELSEFDHLNQKPKNESLTKEESRNDTSANGPNGFFKKTTTLESKNAKSNSTIRLKKTNEKEPKQNDKHSSEIRLKKHEESPVELDFLDIMGLNEVDEESGGDNKEGKKEELGGSKIHHEMELKLGHMYEDVMLTVVSEENSRQFTEYNYGVRSKHSDPYTDHSGSNPGGSDFKDPTLGQSMEQDSLFKPGLSVNNPQRTLSQSTRENNSDLTGLDSMKKGKSDMRVKAWSVMGPKWQRKRKRKERMQISLNREEKEALPAIQSISILDNPENPDKLHDKPEKRFFPNGELTKKKQISMPEEVIPEETGAFDLNQLPMPPHAPAYEIDILSRVTRAKEIRKKEHLVPTILFQLACGLFYEGTLKFGKLHGKGALMLQPVDTEDRDSKETRESLLYEGLFAEDKAHGKGVLYFRDGSTYHGNFSEGRAQGNGVFCGADGIVLAKGIWLHGKYYQ